MSDCALEWLRIFLPVTGIAADSMFLDGKSKAYFEKKCPDLVSLVNSDPHSSFRAVYCYLDNLSELMCGSENDKDNPPGFYLIVVKDRPGADQRSDEENNCHLLARFEIHSEYLINTECTWVTNVPRTGKIDYLTEKIKDQAPFRGIFNKVSFLVLSDREPAASGIWIFGLIDELIDAKSLSDPVDIGRIDMMRTGNIIIQIRDGEDQKFSIKVSGRNSGSSSDTNDLSWLHKIDTVHYKGKFPLEICSAEFRGTEFQLETWVNGIPASRFFYHPAACDRIYSRALEWSIQFQKHTKRENSVFQLDKSYLMDTLGFYTNLFSIEDSLGPKLFEYMSANLKKFNCPIVSSHGDYWCANILVDDTLEISGVIDWDYSNQEICPLIDVFHLILHRKSLFARFNPTGQMFDIFNGNIPKEYKETIISAMNALDLDKGLFASLFMVYWINYIDSRYAIMHVTRNWTKSAFLRIYKLLNTQNEEQWNALLG